MNDGAPLHDPQLRAGQLLPRAEAAQLARSWIAFMQRHGLQQVFMPMGPLVLDPTQAARLGMIAEALAEQDYKIQSHSSSVDGIVPPGFPQVILVFHVIAPDKRIKIANG